MGKGGGGGESVTQTTVKSDTTVNVSSNVTGGPVNIAVGSDFLKPVAEAFLPISKGVEGGIKTLSSQAAAIANQARTVSDFTKKAETQLVAQQGDLSMLIKLMLVVTVAGFGFQFYRVRRA